jgi:GTP cyclohydrolase II
MAPVLAISSMRASILHIGPTGLDTVLLPLDQGNGGQGGEALSLDRLRHIAYPTLDLASPLQGPFSRIKTPPAPAAKAASAALMLCKRAGLLPAAVLGHDRGHALNADLLRVAVDDVIATLGETGGKTELRLQKVGEARLPLRAAENCRLLAFRPSDGGPEHLALLINDPSVSEPVLARLHSQCFTGDLLGSLRCDCGEQLQSAIQVIAEAGGGMLLYLAQEGRGIGLINKLRAYALQDQGFDTFAANERLGFAADEREFQIGAEMLRQLGVARVRLLTNNPEKCAGLAQCGIEVVERIAHRFPSNTHNEAYLAAKKRRGGHYL